MHQACSNVQMQSSDAEFCGEDAGFLLMTWRPYLCRVAEQCTKTPVSPKSCWKSLAIKWGFWLAFLAIEWAALADIFLGLPDMLWLPLFLSTAISLVHFSNRENWYVKTLHYLLIAFSYFLGINPFQFQSSKQLLSGTQGSWLLGQGQRGLGIYKALKQWLWWSHDPIRLIKVSHTYVKLWYLPRGLGVILSSTSTYLFTVTEIFTNYAQTSAYRCICSNLSSCLGHLCSLVWLKGFTQLDNDVNSKIK